MRGRCGRLYSIAGSVSDSAMAAEPKFKDANLEALCDVLGDTSTGQRAGFGTALVGSTFRKTSTEGDRAHQLTYVRDQMGSASIQVTVGIYGHLVPGGTSRRSIVSTANASRRNPGATDVAVSRGNRSCGRAEGRSQLD